MALVLLAFGVIFVAELGDKSQLMALAFATRYRAVPILIGITIATALVHAVSVGIGAVLGATLPTKAITIAAALAFFGFAAWTLRGDELSDEEEAKVDRSSRSAIVAASAAFFLAELGDKTMLATITLATTGNPVRGVARIDARDGRGRRSRHRGGPAARCPAARAGRAHRCVGGVLRVRRDPAGGGPRELTVDRARPWIWPQPASRQRMTP